LRPHVSLPLISLRQLLIDIVVSASALMAVLRSSFRDRMHALSAAEVERNVRAPEIRVYERCAGTPLARFTSQR
jgi:hypothetical protein